MQIKRTALFGISGLVAVLIALAVGWNHVRAQIAAQCHQIRSEAEFFDTDDFGSPFNPFSGTLEIMMTTICNAPRSTVRIGYGQQNHYIYEDAYYWRDHAWQRQRLSGATRDRNWFVGTATGNVPTTEAELAQANFFVAYICHYTNNAWRCGCKNNSDCRPSRWNIQMFSGAPSGAPGPQITFTSDKTEVLLGDEIFLDWNVTGAESCRALGDWNGDKPLQGRENIINIFSPRTYQLQCDGPGGSVTETISITLI